MQPRLMVDTRCPINWDHPLNVGLVGCWSGLLNSGWSGGTVLRDLVRGRKNPNDGTLTGFTLPFVVTSGWVGGLNYSRALIFDGVNDYVGFGSALPISSGGLSISMLYRGATPGSNVSLINRSNKSGVDERNYELNINSGSKFEFIFTTSSAVYQIWESTSTVSTLGLTDGDWHHICLSQDYGNGGLFVLSMDGLSVAGSWTTGTGTANPQTTGQTLAFGGSPTNNNNYLKATLDCVRIYANTMTVSCMAALYGQLLKTYPDIYSWIAPHAYAFTQITPGGNATFNSAWAAQANVFLGGGVI